jgi:hypothetical protein
VAITSSRFRDKIKSICLGKSMPELTIFSIKISFEDEFFDDIDSTERAFEIFNYDADELDPQHESLSSFRSFLNFHFPLLSYIHFPDPHFRLK